MTATAQPTSSLPPSDLSTADAVVVTGAAPLHPAAVEAIPPGCILIAADGGLDHARAAGLEPAIVIGDLDSISADGLLWAHQHAEVMRHQPDKDQTDTELALAIATDTNPDRLIMLAGAGDRLDHTLAAIGALGDPELTSIPTIEGWWGGQRFRVQHGPGEAIFDDLSIGSRVSLLATHGACEGIDASGLRWPLDQFTLAPLSGRGVSNEVTSSTVRITVRTNVLTIMFPDVQEG